jgi:hypothetical protein
MLSTKFRFIWPSGFRGKEFKTQAQPTEPLVLCVCVFAGTCEQDSQLPLPTVFQKQREKLYRILQLLFSVLLYAYLIYIITK